VKKEIDLKDIVKMQNLYIEIFYEEDEDCPDRRVIVQKEKAVQKILDKITNNKGEQLAIWGVIQRESWNTEDKTFKPICDKLRELGYAILQKDVKND
jgi:GH35 family endo-1,4-beta-xylanase